MRRREKEQKRTMDENKRKRTKENNGWEEDVKNKREQWMRKRRKKQKRTMDEKKT
jgi:hypothetical protein